MQLIYLLYGVWHVGVYEPEEQVSQGPALSTQNHRTSPPSMGQGQVNGQQLHAQQKKMVVVPKEQKQRALGGCWETVLESTCHPAGQ